MNSLSFLPLSPADAARLLCEYSRLQWQVLPEGLNKKFVFPDSRLAASFVDAVLIDANAHNHHPDIWISHEDVHLNLITRATGSITQADFASAKRIDLLAGAFVQASPIPRELGSSASGNFGHGGRPGEVGGSSTTSNPLQSGENGHAVGSKAWFGSLTKVGGAKGSNEGGVYKDRSGQQWYVKDYKNPNQANAEQVANDIYRAVGVKVPSSVVSPDGKFATKWEEGTTLGKAGLSQPVSDKILNGYAADVFVANWDAVGTGHDNILIGKDGAVTRIDQGGTLLFRAQGALKPEAGLHGLNEWQSLADPGKNSYYAAIFKSAGVKGPDSLGNRAVRQISNISKARPQGGWQSFVRSAVPHAPSSFIKQVGSMLESRMLLLEKKAAELTLRIGGSSSSGNFGHAGRPGEKGGSAPKNAPATADQKAKAFEMHKNGASHKAVGAALGLHPNTVAHIIIKQKAIAAKLASPKEQAKADVAKAFGVTPKQVDKAIAQNAPSVGPTDKDYENFGKAAKYGYEWKEKTSGPAAGKFAYFQNGVQVSKAADKSESIKTSSTIHYGSGPKDPAVVAKEKADAETKAKAYVQKEEDIVKNANPVEKGAAPPPASPWPISNSVERTRGANYEPKVNQVGESWKASLTGSERQAVKAYTGSAYTSMNGILRGQIDPEQHPSSAKYIGQMKQALAKSPNPPPPELVWRGIGSAGVKEFMGKLSTGDVITMKGFQSTSVDPAKAHSWGGGQTVFEIKPKAGAYVRPISSHSHEYEYVLPHSQRYAVRGTADVSLHGAHTKVIQLEAL